VSDFDVNALVAGAVDDYLRQTLPRIKPAGTAQAHATATHRKRARAMAVSAAAIFVVAVPVAVYATTEHNHNGPTTIGSTGIPSLPATGAATPPSSAPATPAKSAGCPVSAATLLAALRAWPLYSSLEPTNQLTNVQCYQGYAMARTTVVHTDSAHVVFQYNSGSNTWEVLDAGTEGFCAKVPADVQPHLTGC
jgi:hypothetical protein